MTNRLRTLLTAALLLPAALSSAVAAEGGRSHVTIYNQDFALVRESRTLELQRGIGEVRFSEVTALLEPDSVILRDLGDPGGLRILEQNYEGEAVSEGYLLRQNEGKVLRFVSTNPATGEQVIRSGRLIRSGYEARAYGRRFANSRASMPATPGDHSPIVEVDGAIQFFLPGRPLFDALGDRAILKPTLIWSLEAERGGPHDLEVSYLTGGMRWEATYNLIAPEQGDRYELVGWVTLTNRSGTSFDDARIKLMAGDVSKLQAMPAPQMIDSMMRMEASVAAPAVTEKAFDEYHLYTLERPTTLRDQEMKQVEFCRAPEVPGRRFYVYDGARAATRRGRRGINAADPNYGVQSNTDVYAMLEFDNRETGGLGIPLPKGTIKIYRTDDDGGREFIGENTIDHTPADETVRLYLGNAFDLVGERRQLDFEVDHDRRTAVESFEIKLRNHKSDAVEIRVVERLYRWATWEITRESTAHTKTDARSIEFRAAVPADGEVVINYEVRYTW